MHDPVRRPLGRRVWPLRRLLAPFVVTSVVAAFAAWEGVQGRFSVASHASILAAVGVVLALALIAGRGRQRTHSAAWTRRMLRGFRAPFLRGRLRTAAVAGGLVWVLLIAATIGWDAASFARQRHALPTLSRLFGDVTDHDWGRALVFAAWLVLGLYLAVGWRSPAVDDVADQMKTAGATHFADRTPGRVPGRSPDEPPRRSPDDVGGVT
ncbi:MAG TPA: hypothetical protein VMD28_02650 [Acidimicrobiales bacterium]|nr:hypothetical protein [Acidimicrobiales bacterium]